MLQCISLDNIIMAVMYGILIANSQCGSLYFHSLNLSIYFTLLLGLPSVSLILIYPYPNHKSTPLGLP